MRLARIRFNFCLFGRTCFDFVGLPRLDLLPLQAVEPLQLRLSSPWTRADANYALHPASMRLTTSHLQLYRLLDNSAGGRLPISRADASIWASSAGANGRLGKSHLQRQSQREKSPQ
jgi:hypothetical protein